MGVLKEIWTYLEEESYKIINLKTSVFALITADFSGGQHSYF